MTKAKSSLSDSDELHGPLLTWSGDMRIAVVFSKRQAAEAKAKMDPALFLCVNIPRSALFRSVGEFGRFFDEGLSRPVTRRSRSMHEQQWANVGFQGTAETGRYSDAIAFVAIWPNSGISCGTLTQPQT